MRPSKPLTTYEVFNLGKVYRPDKENLLFMLHNCNNCASDYPLVGSLGGNTNYGIAVINFHQRLSFKYKDIK